MHPMFDEYPIASLVLILASFTFGVFSTLGVVMVCYWNVLRRGSNEQNEASSFDNITRGNSVEMSAYFSRSSFRIPSALQRIRPSSSRATSRTPSIANTYTSSTGSSVTSRLSDRLINKELASSFPNFVTVDIDRLSNPDQTLKGLGTIHVLIPTSDPTAC